MAASSFRGRWRYDVFVSFRGEDVRKKFVDHLFKDFNQKGIRVFRDDSELPKGEEISLELYKAIEESRFLLVIFSKDYASSSWCLRELVKILECKQTGEPKHEVHIIFYDVKPHVVRKQIDSYAEAFAKHESSNRTEVEEWKEALTNAANLSGWVLQDLSNGYEATFIEIISSEIFQKLCVGPLDIGEKLVGVDTHVKKLNLLRFVGSNKVHMIGICGISGIGKTTLAKAIYNLLHVHFEGSCFCDVQEVFKREGLTGAQMQLVDDIMKTRDVKIYNVGQGIMVIKKMMPSKPILLVLDDLNHRDQLEALAGACDWFPCGSLIIFTGKDKQLLKFHELDEIYDMDYLNEDESLELFCLYAFHKKHPTRGFEELAKKVVKYVQGHPLALKVLGCFLKGKTEGEWTSELDSLKQSPHGEIQQVLRLSYDGLNRDQQTILLDIAFSFIGEKRDLALSVLDSCELYPETNMRVLVDLSLISISSSGSLQMHELIQAMAREIVREKSKRPEKRSRLSIPSEVYDVLSKTKATDKIKVIDLLKEKSSQKFNINGEAFAPMENLRILKLPNDPNVNYSGRLGYLSNNLKYLSWHGCPFKFLPSDFYPENIVAIDLSYSNIKGLWTTPKRFTRLKILDLNHCRNLISTPDFTEITNLEELNLEGCVNLIKVHPSIGMLKRLVVLNLSGCFKVHTLPQAFGMIKSLVELQIQQPSIITLPSFVFSLTNLLILSFGQNESFWSRGLTTIAQPLLLPQSLLLSSLTGLGSLRKLNLMRCNILQVPESIGGLSNLEDVSLEGNNFTSLPGSLSQLSRLYSLGLNSCKKLEVLPELPPSIEVLYACHCNVLKVTENIGGLLRLKHLYLVGNNFTSLPESLSQLSRLEWLDIEGCKKLEVLPELPPSIRVLYARDCNILQVSENIQGLSRVKNLHLAGNNFTSLPRSLSQLSCLKLLTLDGCRKLEVLPELPPGIEYISAYDCPILVRNARVKSEDREPEPLETCVSCHGSTDKLPPLFRYIDIHSNISEFFHEQHRHGTMEMMYYGNRIPDWFRNQCMGSEVKVELPPDWCYNKFRGYAFCVVFTPKKFGYGMIARFCVNNFDGACLIDDSFSLGRLTNESVVIHDSEMMCLNYRRNKWRCWEEAKYCVTFSFIEENVEVKKCGVRLVCDEDDLQHEMDSSLINYYLLTSTQDCGWFFHYGSKKSVNIEW